MTKMPTNFWQRLASELEALKEQQQDIVSGLARGKYDDVMDASDIEEAMKTGQKRAEWLEEAEAYAQEMWERC